MSQSDARPKRGRPPGKNRVPLKAEERRARNAHYERQRRKAMDHEFTELAKALGRDRDVTPDSKLLRIAIQMVKQSSEKCYATKDLEAENKKIQVEIIKLEEQRQVAEIEDWLLEPI